MSADAEMKLREIALVGNEETAESMKTYVPYPPFPSEASAVILIRRDCAANLMAHHPTSVIPAKAGIR